MKVKPWELKPGDLVEWESPTGYEKGIGIIIHISGDDKTLILWSRKPNFIKGLTSWVNYLDCWIYDKKE